MKNLSLRKVRLIKCMLLIPYPGQRFLFPLKLTYTYRCFIQLDTGCPLSLPSISFFKNVCPNVEVKLTKIVLSTYSGKTVRLLEKAFVKVKYSGKLKTLPLLVVQEGTSALFGRTWLVDVWGWYKVEEDTFVVVKEQILNSQTQVHNNEEFPLFLLCDASSYGAGAALAY